MDPDRAREILLSHAKHPRNRVAGTSPASKFVGECRNPLCGDHVRVYLDLEAETLTSCAIEVRGCTMCTASASMMSELVRGRTAGHALALARQFEEALLQGKEWPEDLKDLMSLSHLRLSRARIPCALIGWKALLSALVNC